MLKVPSLFCIISGGQTGADQGGLLAAQALEIQTGGYAPKGWRTEAGPAEWLQTFDLIEWPDEKYPPRTRANVLGSDATVIFGHRSPGSNLTEETCRKEDKPVVWVLVPIGANDKPDTFKAGPTQLFTYTAHVAFRLWLIRNNVGILNVAGNRESKNLGIKELTKQFLIKVLK